jgi:hypothetical protein
MVEITPSTLDENPGRSATIHTGSKNKLNDKHISPIQEALQWPNTLQRRLKRNIERMQFVIPCREWKPVYQKKEKKKKELAGLEREKERKKREKGHSR